ncbi:MULTISPECIES: hypothetical protein [Caballeronia]|jgi:hypothetical protein|uniref:Uncharacterized protein n=1 Tax=Caballeronia concitans TaxID=1777133 RepID=A0A658QT80_9BURK|nr:MULTISPECIES: hypothetical protein [Caballeronia]KIG10959.1 hypothetical protein BurMR1_1979 [Burkholderia sp. MR1]SAL18274.1 hypothetical protein AWB72_01194 [Caballeronia concitans]
MKKTISTYWPLAILLIAVLTFCMHAEERESAALRRQQVDVGSVSAELARAISYGLVDSDDATAPVAHPAPRTL